MISTPTESIPLRLRPVWARMPEADRIRVLSVPDAYRLQLIELWGVCERNAHATPRSETPRVLSDSQQAELDEKLLRRVKGGEYGPAAQEALEESERQTAPGTGRRVFLRAARRAIDAARRGESR